MRVLVLAAAVLLSGAALLRVGRGAAGESAAAEIPVLTLDPADPSSPVVESAAEAVEVAGAGPALGLPPGAGGRAAAPATRSHGESQATLVLRTTGRALPEAPDVRWLRARDNLAGTTGRGTDRAFGNPSSLRWRWSRASKYGEMLVGVPGWQSVPPVEDEAASLEPRRAFEIRFPIPRPGRMDRLFAMVGDRVSMGRLVGDEVLIDLGDPQERLLRVLVSHADGSPASGIPLVMPKQGSLGDLRTGGWPLNELPTTDENGSARIMSFVGRSPSAVLLGVPPVRRQGPSSEGITLPPAGVIEVAYEGDGGPGDPEPTLSIQSAEPVAFAYNGEWSVITELSAGRATLHAALGERFRLEVKGASSPAVAEVRGPTEPGEVVRVKLSPALVPVVSFRALDEEGEALKDCRLLLRRGALEESFDSRDEWRATTDSQGLVSVELRGVGVNEVLGSLHLRSQRVRVAKRRWKELVGTREVPVAANDGTCDLGTWQLRRVPHLVSGRVVDGEGQPVGGAVVKVDARGKRLRDRDAEGSVTGRYGISGIDGAFEISWDRDPSKDRERRLMLTAKKGEAKLFEPVPFTPGDRDIVLVVEEPSGIRVDLRELSPDAAKGLRLSLVSEVPGVVEKPTELRPGELIEVHHKQPGRYAVRLDYAPESIVLAGDLQLKPGEDLVDPRLNPLSLTGAVQRRSIFVRGADGMAVPSITIGRVRSGRADRRTRLDAVDGAFDVLAYLETPPDSYWIEADGYRRTRVDVLESGMSIELQTAMEVVIQLTGADLSGKPFAMGATWQSTKPWQKRPIKVSFDAQGRGVFEALQAGTYELNSLRAARGRLASPPETKPWWGATFTVSEGGIEVEVPALP